MRKIKYFITAAILAFSSAGFAQSNSMNGWVVGVSDGDTIKILDANKQEHRIRMLGIDAPESKQDFGQVSKRTLSDLVYKKDVEIKFDKKDHYGRIVGKVVFQGQDINKMMIEKGMAWHYAEYAREQPREDRDIYAKAQIDSMNSKIGLWAHKDPIAPWDFRKSKRKQSN